MEIITSTKNPLVTRLAKLSDRKWREAEGLMRLDGVKLYAEAVKSGLEIVYAFAAASRYEKLTGELGGSLDAAERLIHVSDEVLEKLTDEKAPQGIVAFARPFALEKEDAPTDGCFRGLLLSSIRDPGNLGTMIRTAYAFRIDRVYVTADCADLFAPKTLRAAMGTSFRQPIAVVEDEIAFVQKLRAAGCEVHAAALRADAKRLGDFPLPEKLVFAVGNEGHGLSEELIDACTGRVIIPMNPDCESLNAAGAAAVLIWEMTRGRV